jgi:hypothetical protein
MKHVDVSELVTAIPVPAPEMTRTEKLLRWAKIIRSSTIHMNLYHNLEYMGTEHLKMLTVIEHATAPGAATRDPEFKKQGIGSTAYDVMKFFELTKQELHEFSCDCGGAISNEHQARRIEGLAR